MYRHLLTDNPLLVRKILQWTTTLSLNRQKHDRTRTHTGDKLGNYPMTIYNNAYVLEHQIARDSVSPDFHKKTTGLTGLYVNEHPHQDLRALYHRILRVCQMIPAENTYRESTEEIVKQRLGLVEEEPDIQTLEQKIGMGQIEEIIEQAEYELQAARLYVQYKCWEPLVEQPDEAQWRWPIGPGP